MVSVDKDKCIGCAACEATCPDVFEMKDDMKAYVKKGKEKSKDPTIKDAMTYCAVNAISE
jgi:ferredoxin